MEPLQTWWATELYPTSDEDNFGVVGNFEVVKAADAQATIAALQARVKELGQAVKETHGRFISEQAAKKDVIDELTVALKSDADGQVLIDKLMQDVLKLESQLTQRTAECDALKLVNDTHMKTVMKLSHVVEQRTAEFQRHDGELQQICGQALGYPWFKDDQKNFPGATEKGGVCVGEHVGITIAQELANAYRKRTAELEALKIHCAIVEEHKVIAYKDAANLQAELEAVRVDNRTYINERHENMKQIEQLQADLAERTAELEAVSNFIGVKYDAESKTWVSGQAPYLSAGTTKQEACIAAVDALRLACATWETKYRDLQAELEAAKAIQAIDLKNNNAYREQVANLQAELERVSLLSSHNERRFEMLDKKYKEFRTLLLALPKVEGEIEVSSGVYNFILLKHDSGNRFLCGQIETEQTARAIAALWQHRQGMEG